MKPIRENISIPKANPVLHGLGFLGVTFMDNPSIAIRIVFTGLHVWVGLEHLVLECI